MERPYIICHMTMSIDGKVTGDFLENTHCSEAIEAYYELNRSYHADAFACGRVTMEGSFTGGWKPDLSQFEGTKIDREDFTVKQENPFYAVSFDRYGKLGWKSSHIVDEDPGYGGAHIIQVLCESVSDAYLAYLRSISVSYIFAGKDKMDLNLALAKLHRLFGIKTLLLEGGSIINGVFQQENLIDELSLVVAPLTASAEDKPLFMNGNLSEFQLMESKLIADNVLWLNYKK